MINFWYFFLRKQEFSWLVIVTLVACGLYTLLAIPKEASPEVIVPVGIVTTVYPGASASDIEELITIKLEDGIENIDNLNSLNSVSQDGISVITAEFNASADIDASIQDLKDAVDASSRDLPRDAEDPVVSEINFANQPIFVLAVSSDAVPSEFTKLGEDLVSEFKDVFGVSDVFVTGTQPREIKVVVEPKKLASFGLDITAVTNALSTVNAGFPVGSITSDAVEYNVRLDNTLESREDIENVAVANIKGNPIYIRDVATVSKTVGQAKTLSRVSVSGVPSENALTLSIYKKSGVNVTSMSEAVNEKLTEMKSEGGLLDNSQVLVIFDQGEDTKEQLDELVRAGIETVILVMIALFLTIGWRESIVAGLSIPLSFVIAFIGLYVSGNTINFLSLFALILAVGILVDSGIVVTEAIHTRAKRTGNALLAAKETIREYAWPLTAGTMTTVAVFAPLFFLSGVVGQFIASIPFTIIFVLLASIIVSLGMVPLIAIAFTNNVQSNRFEKLQELYTEKAQNWYKEKLTNFLKNTKAQRYFLFILFFGFVLSLLLPVTGVLKVIFFPPEDVDFLFVDIEMPQGTILSETDLVVRKVEEVLYENSMIESFSVAAGAGSSFTGGGNSGGRFANVTITLKPERDVTSADIATNLRNDFSVLRNVNIKITEQQNGPSTGAPVTIKLTGDDLSVLNRIAESAVLELEKIPGTRDVETSSNNSSGEFVLALDSAKAGLYGVNPISVSTALRSAVYGVTATTIRQNGDDIDVVVRLGNPEDLLTLDAAEPVTLDKLNSIEVTTMRGETVLLSTLLRSDYIAANSAINREDKNRLVTITSFTTENITATEIVAKFEPVLKKLTENEPVSYSFGGETEDINRSFTEMFLALISGLLLMLAILVLSFNSVRYSFYLLLTVPYSLIGVFIGLAGVGLSLSFTSLLGVIALAGVIINHAIILMDSLISSKTSTETFTESTLIDQVANASVSRFRPIMLTTITTVIGMIPLSMVSDFWSPLAFAIMFGLSFAMVLTLILIPTLYYRHEKNLLINKISLLTKINKFIVKKAKWLLID